MGYKNTPDFSWSLSRAKLFNECELCYGLYYYGSHNGWKQTSDALTQASYRQKVTKNSEDYLKSSIVECIQEHIYVQKSTIDTMGMSVRADLNKAFLDSKNKQDQWFTKPKQYNMLQEMEYVKVLEKSLITTLTTNMSTFIKNFFQSVTLKEVEQQKPELINPDKYLKFSLERLNNIPAYTSIDVLYINDKNKMVAINFNMSDATSSIEMHSVMATYLVQKYKIKLDDIIIREEFLMSGKHSEHTVTANDIDDMYVFISESVSMMREKVVDGNLDENSSIPIKDFLRSPHHVAPGIPLTCPYCSSVQLDLEHYPNGLKSYQSYNYQS